MRYTVEKIFIVVFCSIFIAIGLGILFKGGPESALLGAAFIGIPCVLMFIKLRQTTKFQTMTYDWYKATHPRHVHDGKISCYSCNNKRIHARALMNHTYHREHFCTQCGKTLYYSREQS